ncbi:MAG TPA: glycosyltransferase [Alphaproteobacteria bacterium]|nr:glycosyltransferase [Alphaproteobacteria bacterium]
MGMKVLHILNELKHSGAEVMLRLAYERFQSSGIESHILSTGARVGDYAAVLRQTGYIIHHIPFRKSPSFFIELLTLFRHVQFRAVHIHTERGFIWYVLMAKLAGVPTVIRTFHSVFLFSHYLHWKRCLQRQISKHIFRATHTAISDSVLVVENEAFGNACLLIRNWTDVEKYHPPSEEERTAARRLYQLEPEDFAIVTVGTCTPVKNHLAIFTAVKKVNGLLDQGKVVVLHVGAGPSLDDEEFYVNRNNVGLYAKFLGVLDDVRPCLYAADAFVMTSRWEGLGVAAMEAMSTGLPALLYNVYGLRDLLQNGNGGLLVDPNEDSLVEALLQLIRDPELRQLKASGARQMILKNYSLEDSVAKFIRLYAMNETK